MPHADTLPHPAASGLADGRAADAYTLAARYAAVRARTEALCAGLQPEDYVPQPVADVSPPKWHLAHATWFFETFVLAEHAEGYAPFDERFAYLFNSYYEAAGPRILRTSRGNLTRPSTERVYAYRAHVDAAMAPVLAKAAHDDDLARLVTLGLHHEQQHQELLATDIKYILGHNPLFPSFGEALLRPSRAAAAHGADGWVDVPAGVYAIGHEGPGFCFDNELGRHRVFLEAYRIRRGVVTNREYLAFVAAGGYRQVEYWLSEGWAFAKTLDQDAPLHWHRRGGAGGGDAGARAGADDDWWCYTAEGLRPLDPDAPVAHVSYYEADAYARWAGARLATEFEWEAAQARLDWGQVWEWTSSAYGPYPGFRTAPGALGEYNGKWMVNQQVLRGASVATSPGHSRPTYRNFFHADKRWQYTGIRLAAAARS